MSNDHQLNLQGPLPRGPCCGCNGTNARCKFCACVKAKRACTNCRLVKNGCCPNVNLDVQLPVAISSQPISHPSLPSPVSQPPALSQTSPQQLSHPPLQLLDTTQTSSRPVTPESPSSLVDNIELVVEASPPNTQQVSLNVLHPAITTTVPCCMYM